MADYEKMYHTLFNSVTNAIELLKKAQLTTEEIYLESKIIHMDKDKNTPGSK